MKCVKTISILTGCAYDFSGNSIRIAITDDKFAIFLPRGVNE